MNPQHASIDWNLALMAVFIVGAIVALATAL